MFPARAQEVADARAVAMTAARTHGLSMPQIAEHFGKDYSSVIHAVRRTGERPRLPAAASAIAEDITIRYQQAAAERPALHLVRVPESAAAADKPTAQDLTVVGAAIDAAARRFGTDPELLHGPDRTRMVADARAVAMTAARINGLSLPRIAAEFGDRHHAVVLQATRRVEKTPPLRELAEQIARDIPRAEAANTGGVRGVPRRSTSKSPHLPAANMPPETSVGGNCCRHPVHGRTPAALSTARHRDTGTLTST